MSMVTGSHHTAETKAKMSLAQQGTKNHRYGKTCTPETKKKISDALKGERCYWYGRKHTTDELEKMSRAMAGEKNHQYGRTCEKSTRYGKHHTLETLQKMAVAKVGENNYWYGKKQTPEHSKKIGDAQRGEKNHMYGKYAEENPNWRGGISFEPYCPKFNEDLRRRVRTFFDNRCVVCGKTKDENKRNLCCHHVEYSKSACCDGKPVCFAALCSKCHTKTNGNRVRWEAMLHKIIDEIYDGRSYYTREEYARIK